MNQQTDNFGKRVFPDPLLERISMHKVRHDILMVLNLEKGIFYTVLQMLRAPGEAMHQYLFVDRSRFMDPTRFLLLTVALLTFVTLNFFPEIGFYQGLEQGFKAGENPEKQAIFGKLIALYSDYMSVLMLLTVPPAALVSWILFGKYKLHYAEHLVINAYLWGFLSFITIFTQLAVKFIDVWVYSSIIYIGYAFYNLYFFKQVFKLTFLKSILLGILYNILSFVLGTFFFVISGMVLGLIAYLSIR